jgi:hypothetical protein
MFMKRLINVADRKMFRIFDRLRLRHARNATERLQDRTLQIEVLYLAVCSPESNPDIYSNCNLRAGVRGKPRVRDHKGLAERVIANMRKLYKSLVWVLSHIGHPKIAYAA